MRYLLVCVHHTSKPALSSLLQLLIPEPNDPIFMHHSVVIWKMEKEGQSVLPAQLAYVSQSLKLSIAQVPNLLMEGSPVVKAVTHLINTKSVTLF